MWKKVLPNVLYNIGIFLCLVFGYDFIVQRQYVFLLGAVVFIAIFIVLKIRLYKELKGVQKP